MGLTSGVGITQDLYFKLEGRQEKAKLEDRKGVELKFHVGSPPPVSLRAGDATFLRAVSPSCQLLRFLSSSCSRRKPQSAAQNLAQNWPPPSFVRGEEWSRLPPRVPCGDASSPRPARISIVSMAPFHFPFPPHTRRRPGASALCGIECHFLAINL